MSCPWRDRDGDRPLPEGVQGAEGAGRAWFSRAMCKLGRSLDPPLHTQQQVVSERGRQWELGGSLPTVATQLSADGQAGQVL